MKKFQIELIQPSHYDDQGYVIQWWRSFGSSNSLACLYSLFLDASRRKVLGEDVEIQVAAHDEHSSVLPIRRIVRRLGQGRVRGLVGLVGLVGVQSNQYPRALDIARPFRQAGIPVVIGGFHVSAFLAMLGRISPDLQEALDLGITLFAGEGEGHLDRLLLDAERGRMEPFYNYMSDPPELQGRPTPRLPMRLVRRSLSSGLTMDTSRGCPFGCSFCTVINFHGRKSRFRSAEDVEEMVRFYHLQHGRRNFFFTDDDFARNRNWEDIFDRLISLREKERFRLKFGLQVDAAAHRIPGFIDKAARAGCNSVFIGLENINSENLMVANKPQNRVSEYREMLEAWRSRRIVTLAGYILGFPSDTPASIERDIRTIQEELPIDILMFFMLTPLPGSEDHRKLELEGARLEPDLNRYDSEHATMRHPKMSSNEWEAIFRKAWDLYYSPEHVKRILERVARDRISLSRLFALILLGRCSMKYENVHPFQCGALRRRVRRQRRFGLPLESPLRFYPRNAWEMTRTGLNWGRSAWELERMKKRLRPSVKAGRGRKPQRVRPAAAC